MNIEKNTDTVKNFFTLFSARRYDAVLDLIDDYAQVFHTKSKAEFRNLLTGSGNGLQVSTGLDPTTLKLLAGNDHVVAEIDSTDYPYLRFCFIFEFDKNLILTARDYNRNMESEKPNPGKRAAIGSWPPIHWPPRP